MSGEKTTFNEKKETINYEQNHRNRKRKGRFDDRIFSYLQRSCGRDRDHRYRRFESARRSARYPSGARIRQFLQSVCGHLCGCEKFGYRHSDVRNREKTGAVSSGTDKNQYFHSGIDHRGYHEKRAGCGLYHGFQPCGYFNVYLLQTFRDPRKQDHRIGSLPGRSPVLRGCMWTSIRDQSKRPIF